MSGYYKLNTDGTIQSRNKQPDESWLSLDSLEAREDGSYYKYYNTDGTPDLVKEQAESDAQALADWKASRAEAVANIKVTTLAGNEFDGDEVSQTRMSRAISVMEDTDTTMWVLANNAVDMVSKAELIEALKLSGEAQTALWVYE